VEKVHMVEFRLNISDPTGKAKQVVVSGPQALALLGLKIGDTVDGGPYGYPGAKLVIRGGSDKSGAPMRPDLPGGGKYQLLLSGPPGFHPKAKGERRRKIVRGNMITEDIVQINLAVVKEVKES